MNEVALWVFLAAFFIAWACAELVCRVLRKKPVWSTLKDWLVKLLDTLTGGM
jgi:hypothetical protein